MTTDNPTALRFFSTGAERLFRVADVTGDDTHGYTEMVTGPWLGDELGRPCRGTLGVVMDDVMGHLVSGMTPEGFWAVSTEIHLDFVADPPTDGSVLRAESWVLGRGAQTGLAGGRVVDEQGRLIACGSTRLQTVPLADPPGAPAISLDDLDSRLGAGSIIDLLGAEHAWGASGIEFGPSPMLANPMGNIHGGVLLCASEITGSAALPIDAGFRTTSIHISYLRPCPSDAPVTFAPKIVHRGRSLGIVEVSSRNTAGKTCTTATITCSAVH
ncbi:PaaI family thioesterase [Rhodococcus sp. NPDC003383]